MIRTQISLTREQMQALRREAKRRGVSIAALVRRAVDAEVKQGDREERIRMAMEVMGSYSSGRTDISVNHDLYLDPRYEP